MSRLIVLSDLEMGAGGPTDDFHHDAWLVQAIDGWGHRRGAQELVFAGDTLDLLKTSLNGHYPSCIDADVALAKLDRIHAAHRPVFDALGRFLAHPGRRVHLLIGNHDPELAMPVVQERIRELVDGHVEFAFALDRGELRIEHGMQQDPMFAVDDRHPLLPDGLLAVPWGSVALMDAVLPLQPHLHMLDRLKPRERLLQLLPEAEQLMMQTFWTYWTRDFWSAYLGGDPVRRLSWPMVREVLLRFVTKASDVSGLDAYKKQLNEGPHRVLVTGHFHDPGIQGVGGRQLITLPCVRDEFYVAPDGRIDPVPLHKGWAELELVGDRVRSTALHQVQLTTPNQPPAHVDLLRPVVRALLDNDKPARQAG